MKNVIVVSVNKFLIRILENVREESWENLVKLLQNIVSPFLDVQIILVVLYWKVGLVIILMITDVNKDLHVCGQDTIGNIYVNLSHLQLN